MLQARSGSDVGFGLQHAEVHCEDSLQIVVFLVMDSSCQAGLCQGGHFVSSRYTLAGPFHAVS